MLLVQSPPRISPERFCAVLEAARSPAAPDGLLLYNAIAARGLDPAIALAFFAHESTYGTRGRAPANRSWGNLRRGKRAAAHTGGFAVYASWLDGVRDWCDLILGPIYVGAGRTTVESIVPIYAPSSDGNVPAAYIAAVRSLVARWEAESRPGDVWAAWGTAHPLPPEQQGFAIPRAWLAAGGLGAALTGEVYRPDGGASVQWFEGGLIAWLGGDRTEVVRV